MQGLVLRVGDDCNLILGDDGARYSFDVSEWRDSDTTPEAGARVDFDVRGANAAEIYLIPVGSPLRDVQPHQPPSSPQVAATPKPTPPAPQPSATRPSGPSNATAAAEPRTGLTGWRWLAAGGVVLVVLAIVGAFALGIIPSSGSKVGKEIARLSHEGREYVLVEYGKDLAIFRSSGSPVTSRSLADEVLRSYAWRKVLEEFDADELADVSRKVSEIDDRVAGTRDVSNDVVYVLDYLDGLEADIPFLGSVSAMDVIRESFSGVGDAESMIRSFDSELNDLGDNASVLSRASRTMLRLDLTSVAGDENDSLFAEVADAASDLESTAGSVRESVSDVRAVIGSLERALRSASDTPIIGGAIEDSARTVGRFESQLSGLSDVLEGIESDLSSLGDDMEHSIESADKIHESDMKRWLEEPHDTEWPPDDPEG